MKIPRKRRNQISASLGAVSAVFAMRGTDLATRIRRRGAITQANPKVTISHIGIRSSGFIIPSRRARSVEVGHNLVSYPAHPHAQGEKTVVPAPGRWDHRGRPTPVVVSSVSSS